MVYSWMFSIICLYVSCVSNELLIYFIAVLELKALNYN